MYNHVRTGHFANNVNEFAKCHIKRIFKNLEAQTSFSVVYRDIILSENPDVVVSASNRPLKDILSQVLENTAFPTK